MNRKLIHRLADRLPAVLGLAATLAITSARAHDAEPIEFSEIGIPYAWGIELGASEETHIEAGHVGAWSWDEDGFPATARGWTHTSTWVKVDLTEPAEFTVVLASQTNVAWPSVDDPTRLAGTNLFPSFTLYRGWDTDAGTPVDQDHTFNNRGNIEWAEDVTYLDHLDNSTAHSATRTWVLPAGRYTLNLGGNSPAVIAEGRQGYTATFSTTPVPIASVAAGTGSVVVTWSGSIVGRRLHEAASPEGPWTPVNGEPSIVHSRRQQTLEAAGAARFFKLLP